MRCKTLRYLLVVGLVVVGMGWAASQALAGQAEIRGRGAFRARGVGIANPKCVGRVRFELRGAGVLCIRNFSRLNIIVRGKGRKYKIGDTLYLAGWKGVVVIKSKVTSSGRRTRINARFGGGKVKLRAVGKGKAQLKGRGKYKTRGGHVKKWRRSGSGVKFARRS